ncbi:hypothetical protein Purlil1_4235 [Purpureocillium lilacinum]|uniref:Uncharacterized protein n=1 Tax=Purpureocillium lilacinum TaxID=33203 RepID=A0ABR0C552_PURLI|nr:hypothetical protein Purlil1_4235 [Purpureocillium lilacinum]
MLLCSCAQTHFVGETIASAASLRQCRVRRFLGFPGQRKPARQAGKEGGDCCDCVLLAGGGGGIDPSAVPITFAARSQGQTLVKTVSEIATRQVGGRVEERRRGSKGKGRRRYRRHALSLRLAQERAGVVRDCRQSACCWLMIVAAAAAASALLLPHHHHQTPRASIPSPAGPATPSIRPLHLSARTRVGGRENRRTGCSGTDKGKARRTETTLHPLPVSARRVGPPAFCSSKHTEQSEVDASASVPESRARVSLSLSLSPQRPAAESAPSVSRIPKPPVPLLSTRARAPLAEISRGSIRSDKEQARVERDVQSRGGDPSIPPLPVDSTHRPDCMHSRAIKPIAPIKPPIPNCLSHDPISSYYRDTLRCARPLLSLLPTRCPPTGRPPGSCGGPAGLLLAEVAVPATAAHTSPSTLHPPLDCPARPALGLLAELARVALAGAGWHCNCAVLHPPAQSLRSVQGLAGLDHSLPIVLLSPFVHARPLLSPSHRSSPPSLPLYSCISKRPSSSADRVCPDLHPASSTHHGFCTTLHNARLPPAPTTNRRRVRFTSTAISHRTHTACSDLPPFAARPSARKERHLRRPAFTAPLSIKDSADLVQVSY